jgi:hypothetical protein
MAVESKYMLTLPSTNAHTRHASDCEEGTVKRLTTNQLNIAPSIASEAKYIGTL